MPLEVATITALAGTLNTIYDIVDKATSINGWKNDAVSAYSNKKSESQLQQPTMDFDFSRIPEEYREQVERWCGHQQITLSTGRLFSDEVRAEFCNQFFDKNRNALMDKQRITEQLNKFLSSYDHFLRSQMSVGERAVYQQNKDNHEEQLQWNQKIYDAVTAPSPTLSTLHTANEDYKRAFGEVLFLHDREVDKDVTLANLYVSQRYQEGNKESGNIADRLEQFVNQDKERFLLIEGDAGSGKTTLVEWLNYHSDDAEGQRILGGRKLVTVRLRDVDKDRLSDKNGLLSAITDYLGIDKKQLPRLLQSAFLVLDGYDELCIIDKVLDYSELLEELTRLKRTIPVKVLLTSRPNYIHTRGISSISLLHFNQTQREQWLTHYQKKCNRTVSTEVEEYIKSIDKNSESAIFDTPMVLYMIATHNPPKESLANSWQLYHTIFYESTRDTAYNEMTEDDDTIISEIEHPASEQWDVYYRINEEIAYRMYQTGNEKLYITSEELSEIIEELSHVCPELKDHTKQEIVKQCHALCGYWKIRSEDGFLEFYHNNIRDFFLCEKLYRELNALYNAPEWSDERTAVKLVELLQYSRLEKIVLSFAKQRSIWLRDNQTFEYCKGDFSGLEQKTHHLPDFFELLMTNGNLFWVAQTQTSKEVKKGIHSNNPIEGISVATAGILEFYDAVCVPCLGKTKNLSLFYDAHRINGIDLLCQIFECSTMTQLMIPKVDLHYIDLGSANLSLANLYGTDLHGAVLRFAVLNSAVLHGAVLCFAVLTGTDLHNADLRYVDLRNADLRYARLPDGFSSPDQQKQVEHLKSLNIEGLII